MVVCRLLFKRMLYAVCPENFLPFYCFCVVTVNFQLLDSQTRFRLHGNSVKIEHIFGFKYHIFRNIGEVYLKDSKVEKNVCNFYFMAR